MRVENETFYTTKELAMRVGVSPRTVEGWRNNGQGPQHTAIGGRVMYKVSDVDLWLVESHLRSSLERMERAEKVKARRMEGVKA